MNIGIDYNALPPTTAQIRAITRWCMIKHIYKPLEERVRTQGEAGKLIRELRRA